MTSVSTKSAFRVIEYVASIAFLCLGCFFIYQGEVWQRFNLRRTNFAKYDEEITELLTIKAKILLKIFYMVGICKLEVMGTITW